mmetsp:Transcript_6505/g.14793  ORF Transcript_6505/g.14793 Transcript_6505/m.14793 type:complete len:201 (-) Transcript_6505:1582-2184(-)
MYNHSNTFFLSFICPAHSVYCSVSSIANVKMDFMVTSASCRTQPKPSLANWIAVHMASVDRVSRTMATWANSRIWSTSSTAPMPVTCSIANAHWVGPVYCATSRPPCVVTTNTSACTEVSASPKLVASGLVRARMPPFWPVENIVNTPPRISADTLARDFAPMEFVKWRMGTLLENASVILDMREGEKGRNVSSRVAILF